MRITCEQCGRNINSNLCAEYCDHDKRQKQFERVNKEVDGFFAKAFPEPKIDKK